jgi:hypothetical protein
MLDERIFSDEGSGIVEFYKFGFCLLLARALCILNSTINRSPEGLLLS